MQLTLGICILVAVYYWLCNLDLGNLGRALMNPTFIGVIFGPLLLAMFVYFVDLFKCRYLDRNRPCS